MGELKLDTFDQELSLLSPTETDPGYTKKELHTYYLYWYLEHFFGKEDGGGRYGQLRNELSQKIVDRMPAVTSEKLKPVDMLEKSVDPSWVIKNYIIPRRPFIIKGFCNDWPALGKWNLDFFEKEHGDFVTPLVRSNYTNWKYKESTLAHAIQKVREGSLDYAKLSNILHYRPELKKDLKEDEVRAFQSFFGNKSSSQFFLGAANTDTFFHCALSSVFFIQMMGRKKWYLIDEKYTPQMNPQIIREPHFLSDPNRCNIGDPNQKAFFDKIPMREIELEPGDLYFNPALTWHYVKNPTASIGIGLRYTGLQTPFQNPLSSILMMFASQPYSFLRLFQNPKGIFFPKRWP